MIACKDLKVPIDEAIPLALIFNELINNVKKHTLGHHGVKIEISATLNKTDLFIVFKDHGPGLPDDFDWKNTKSMGMKTIHLMSQQLKAQTNVYSNDNGFVFELRLKRKSTQMCA